MDSAKAVAPAGAIFDLDGTLLDSLADLADSANAVLEERGFPTWPVEAYRTFVGNGMEILMERALPPTVPKSESLGMAAAMREVYGRNWHVKTRPYEGIVPLLAALADAKVPMGVLSNKPHALTCKVISHYFPDTPFVHVQGKPDGGRGKPDPGLALDLARRLGFHPDRVAFVGDSCVDMDTAVAAGMVPVGCLWGFRTRDELLEHGARVLLGRPSDLLAHVAAPA
ncbi:MAG: HAD family hydrolase [Desulfovibrio sp.]|jgi:phosphoglycolate phosphatase|nr:HAD family hydrolase [Desulfovibrio sp.]